MPSAALVAARWQQADPAAIAVLRSLRGVRRERRRPSRASRERMAARWPHEIDRRYARLLIGRVGQLQAAAFAHLRPLMSMALDSYRLDAEADMLIRATDTVRVQVRTGKAFDVGLDGVRSLSRQVDLFAGQKVDRIVGRIPVIGGNVQRARLSGDLDAWVGEQVRLIRSIDERYFDDLQALIKDAVSKGTRSVDLARQIAGKIPQEHRGAISAEANARRIARDQIGTLNSKITRKRYAEAGVASYRWRTVKDEAVRPKHAELEGQVFAIGGPGAVGAGVFGQDIHPGEDVLCRCTEEPTFDDEDEVDDG